MLRHLASLLKSAPESPQGGRSLTREELDLIVPMIKAGNPSAPPTVEGTTPIRLSFEQSPAAKPFVADMLVMYAIDRPNHLEYISNQVARASGLSIHELHDRAVRNLPNRLNPVQVIDLGAGMFGLAVGGVFEASLLLVDDLWPKLAKHLPGVPLAAVPSRDLLFVIGSQKPDAEHLIALRAGTTLEDSRYAISQSVLMRDGNGWRARTN